MVLIINMHLSAEIYGPNVEERLNEVAGCYGGQITKGLFGFPVRLDTMHENRQTVIDLLDMNGIIIKGDEERHINKITMKETL